MTLLVPKIGAAQQDPILAIVLHSSISDIEDVIVDVITKRDGKLLLVQRVEIMEAHGEFVKTGNEIMRREVAAQVLEIEERFLSKLPRFNLNPLGLIMASMTYLD